MSRPRVLHDAATLSTRVRAVEEDIRDLKDGMAQGFASLNAKLDDRSKIAWPAWGLFVGVFLAVGGFAYWPIREAQTDAKLQRSRDYQELVERDRRIFDEVLKARIQAERLDERMQHFLKTGASRGN